MYNPYNLFELDVAMIVKFLLVFESIDYSFFGETKWTVETDEGFNDFKNILFENVKKYM